MHNHRSANDRIGSIELQKVILVVEGGSVSAIGLDVTHVSMMTFLIIWAAVFLALRIEMWASSLTSFYKISELMDVEAM